MTLQEKLNLDYEGLIKHGPITIVAFGDSVTHGAVGAGEIDYETVYHRRLAKMISAVRDYVPVNVINAGIGGITAKGSLERMDEQVLAHRPDLVIVSFGLNDVNGTLDEYLDSLKIIFARCKAQGIETVFMTPNMLNTSVVEETEKQFYEYAHVTAEMQNSGKMDKYIYAAKDLALQMGVKVADCYSKWKELAKTQDTTKLLANYINHPTREMHQLFADTLFETVFEGTDIVKTETEHTMFRK
ncbi:MAG: GDSL family lipase [Clostridia bacterium]|nr:GDSL family lipase [Clostridia bacterium]